MIDRRAWARIRENDEPIVDLVIEVVVKDDNDIDRVTVVSPEEARHLGMELLFMSSEVDATESWVMSLRSLKFDEEAILGLLASAMKTTTHRRGSEWRT